MRNLAWLLVLLTACGFPRPARLGDDAGNPGDDAGIDAPPVCTGPLDTPDNCGACGHSCGGGVCDRGVCDAVALPNVTGATSLWVDNKTLYFTVENRVLSCPASGCVNQPTQLFDPGANGYPSFAVRVANGTLFFVSAPVQATEREAVYGCPLAGCPTPAPIVGSGGFGVSFVDSFGADTYYSGAGNTTSRRTCAANAGACSPSVTVISDDVASPLKFAGSADQIFYINGSGVVKCPYAGCGSPSAPTLLSASMPTGIAYFNNLIYMQFGNDNNAFSGAIRTCTTTDCDADKPKDIITKRGTIVAFTVDNDGVYWMEDNPAGSGPASLFMCKPGCVGGAKTLATAVTSAVPNTRAARTIVTDNAFIYWINDAAGAAMRIAKPL